MGTESSKIYTSKEELLFFFCKQIDNEHLLQTCQPLGYW